MTEGNILSIAISVIGSIVTIITVIVAVLTFYFARKKDAENNAEWKGGLNTDLRYIRDGIDDLKHDNKDIKENIRELDRRVTLVEASAKSAHHRLDDMQRKGERHESN